MRIKVNFYCKEKFFLPVHYNSVIQGFIYSHLNPVLREFLHEKGYEYGKRRFKLFTFSRILGKINFQKDKFLIKDRFSLIISSPKKNILTLFAENLIKAKEIKLNGKEVFINSIDIYPEPEIKEQMDIKMLSPITIYSTLSKEDGLKKTYYYSPFEKEFSKLIKENLEKKFFLIYGEKFLSEGFDIVPIDVKNTDQKILKFKTTVIKGWLGKYKIKGEKEILRVGYECGLGSKNSEGFGCFEPV